ncbi:variant surface glycoprotein (VSG, atypical), putative [Trypanosoma brucei brucei TREU927]|uniref:Variant surface glycoprotein (VSG, atypical), putative n=1 Tax=Trypanosoma brucei brucei (strain 927/4 GUTat10.1) TaxID=185431 RepID=Q38CP6_TRYB2|nr:variant surface glycoprotein [Trypanosoma brucei brucei TREU927]EAN77424.1 variant surface glycoprotein (VSG, atypical), putative [Trypanosoma brucei brucei TREU927]
MTQTSKRRPVLYQMLLAILSLISTSAPTMGTQEALKAKGFDDSCKIANELMKYGSYAETITKTLTSHLFEVETILHDIKKLMKSGTLARNDDNINLLMHTRTTVDEAKAAVRTHLAAAIDAGNEGAFVAGAILETTHLFFAANNGGSNYCMSNDGAGGRAAINDIPDCKDRDAVRRTFKKEAVATLTGAQHALTNFGTGGDGSKGVDATKSCRLSATDGTNGVMGAGGGTAPTIYLMAGLLKLTGSVPAATSWSTGHPLETNNPITKVKALKPTCTASLDAATAALGQLTTLGSADPNPTFKAITTTEAKLGLGDTEQTVEISVPTLKAAHKAIKKLRGDAVTASGKSTETTKRAQLTQEITPPPPPTECNPITTEGGCNEIKIEADCNATAACSFNKTETDENKKCKLDTEKAKKKSVSVTQAQTGGPETTTEKCKDNKSEAVCKDGCKWEGTECKDSSILVNKKIALIVSSFVGFVEF